MLAAARCNLFSHSLAAYQTNWVTLNQKNQEVLEAHIKVIEKEPRKHNFGILKELAQEVEELAKGSREEGEQKLEVSDKDQQLFFGDEFCDSGPSETKSEEKQRSEVGTANEEKSSEILIDYEKDFDEFMASSNILLPSQLLMDDSFFNSSVLDSNIELMTSLVPSQANQGQSNIDLLSPSKDSSIQLNKNPSKKTSDVGKWFSLFAELDPLNQQTEQDNASKNLHAA